MKAPINTGLFGTLLATVLVSNVQGMMEDKWILDVYTSADERAGSYATVGIMIFGTRDETNYYTLPVPNKQFKRGARFTQKITRDSDVGQAKSVRVWYDNEGKTSPWKLDRIELRREKDISNVYVFTCHCWFYPKKGFMKELSPDQTRWTATIVTGTTEYSNTDHVYIIIVGSYAESEEKLLFSKHYEFRNGTSVKMDFITDFVGAPKEIKVRHYSTTTYQNVWYLDTIELVRNSPQPSERYPFNFYSQLYDNATTSTTLYLARPRWRIMVRTSWSKYAGTNGTVKIQIGGSAGNSTVFRLDTPKDDFTVGAGDIFYQYTDTIGTPEWIKVWISYKYGWSLEYIILYWVGKVDRPYLFECKCWLTKLSPYKYLTLYQAPTIPPWMLTDVHT